VNAGEQFRGGIVLKKISLTSVKRFRSG